VSYGGSSTLVNFVMVGMLLRISASNKPPRVQ
jgi:cell division protein FtsW (lipid II flippase)